MKTRKIRIRKIVNEVERELAVSRALSALCGGSGVGQAPELPQKAEVNGEDKLHLFLPIAPEILKSKVQIEDRIIGNVKEVIREDEVGSNPPSLKLRKGRENSNFRQATRSFLTLASVLLILISVAGFIFTFGPVIKAEINYRIKNQASRSQNSNKVISKLQAPARNASHSEAGGQNSKKNNMPLILPITAVNEVNAIDFPASSSIVIPKIGAQAEFFVNTDASNYDEYSSVLQKGIAHASGTALPGEIGNTYFFAHSAGNLFDVARFNAVFYLISNLEKGDAIYVAFGNQKFKYTVYDKKEVDPTDTEYLNNRKDNGRMLTLQTCTPPGTDWRRLLIFAKIEE